MIAAASLPRCLLAGLAAPITDFGKLCATSHVLYLAAQRLPGGSTCVLGLIKFGRKRLFIYGREGDCHEIEPVCALDFFVHPSVQRGGIGRRLYDFAMDDHPVERPHTLGYDRPSPKFIAFLAKHFNLKAYVPQVNNFVVFNRYFERGSTPRARPRPPPSPPQANSRFRRRPRQQRSPPPSERYDGVEAPWANPPRRHSPARAQAGDVRGLVAPPAAAPPAAHTHADVGLVPQYGRRAAHAHGGAGRVSPSLAAMLGVVGGRARLPGGSGGGTGVAVPAPRVLSQRQVNQLRSPPRDTYGHAHVDAHAPTAAKPHWWEAAGRGGGGDRENESQYGYAPHSRRGYASHAARSRRAESAMVLPAVGGAQAGAADARPPPGGYSYQADHHQTRATYVEAPRQPRHGRRALSPAGMGAVGGGYGMHQYQQPHQHQGHRPHPPAQPPVRYSRYDSRRERTGVGIGGIGGGGGGRASSSPTRMYGRNKGGYGGGGGGSVRPGNVPHAMYSGGVADVFGGRNSGLSSRASFAYGR